MRDPAFSAERPTPPLPLTLAPSRPASYDAASDIRLTGGCGAHRLPRVNTASGRASTTDLGTLLATTLILLREVAGDEAAWTAPLADSQAGEELAAQEARPDRPHGSWPWLAALKIARWCLQTATELAEAFGAELQRADTSYGADVACRAVLEHASLAFWLLDPDIDGDDRLARALVYRLHTADQTKRAVDSLNLADGEERTGYGELPDEVAEEIARLGPGWTHRRESVSFDGHTVAWPGYTERVTHLARLIWPQQERLPYAVLSAVAHAELLGLVRNLAAPADGGDLRPDAAGAATWLWHDAYLVIGALLFGAERAAAFLGRTERSHALRSWTAVLDHALPALRPRPRPRPRP